ncbi:MAG: hypothetical protein E7675_07195 [Ruminococcaceae bacterium]|nr:hypothetical protein [Oscillospiraceae bacterium]
MARKLLVVILAAVMCVSSLAACQDTTSTATPPATNGTTAPTGTGTSAPVDTSDIVNPFENEEKGEAKKEHVMMETLPSSATLVGTDFLPPIDNQGGVGSCASQSVAYTQFTNAVARYLHSLNPDSEFKPAKDSKYCFSPKFTYTYSGAGTAWVYNILVDHGCLTSEYSGFYKDSGGGSQLGRPGNYYKQSIKWDADKDDLFKALNYRLNDYEQIWFTNAPYSGKMTTSENGRELLFKIKEAVASGNVVVTGGYPSRWKTGMVYKAGDIAKMGQKIITYSVAEGDGGHQVSIVGYDDNVETQVGGVVLKGAFLMANSWGESYGDQGYIWVAYDALNTVSEYEQLNDEKFNRGWTFDQFCFTYWETDVEVTMPELMVELEVETADREGFYVSLTREDATGSVSTYMPYLFKYGAGDAKIHENYGGDANFGGTVGGAADTGYITLSYEKLSSMIPKGATFENYIWGVDVFSTTKQDVTTIKSVKLINSKGEVIQEIVPEGDNRTLKNGRNVHYEFNLGKELKSYSVDGEYTLSMNGTFIENKKNSFGAAANADAATKFVVKYDSVTNTYKLYRDDEDYLLDIKGKVVEAGAIVKFNAPSNTRGTQTWKLLDNGDGTYAIYLEKTDEAGRYYAIGLKDGQCVLVTGADIKTYGTWTFNVDVNKSMDIDFTTEGTPSVKVAVKTGKTISTVKVVDSKGAVVATKTVNAATYEEAFTSLAKGTYTLCIDSTAGNVVYSFVVK